MDFGNENQILGGKASRGQVWELFSKLISQSGAIWAWPLRAFSSKFWFLIPKSFFPYRKLVKSKFNVIFKIDFLIWGHLGLASQSFSSKIWFLIPKSIFPYKKLAKTNFKVIFEFDFFILGPLDLENNVRIWIVWNNLCWGNKSACGDNA